MFGVICAADTTINAFEDGPFAKAIADELFVSARHESVIAEAVSDPSAMHDLARHFWSALAEARRMPADARVSSHVRDAQGSTSTEDGVEVR